MDYLMVLEVSFARSGPGKLAVDAAFAEHLRMLRRMLAPRFDRLVVAGPESTEPLSAAQRASHVEIDEHAEGIVFLPLFPSPVSRRAFWLRHALEAWRRLWRATGTAGLTHTGITGDVARPTGFFALVAALLQRRPTQFVVDIDYRRSAELLFRSGVWSRRTREVSRWLWDPLRALQIRLAVRCCDLVLLKGRRIAEDFGRGRPNVHDFLDAAHAPEQVLSDADALARAAWIRAGAGPLELVYFGRLVRYKGLDFAIRALARARKELGADVRLRIVGSGEERPALQALAARLGVADVVSFESPRAYGPELFGELAKCHLAVMTPIAEDTPRAALDALAAGLPLLAFDLQYFADLARSGAVELAPWPDEAALAQRMAALAADRARVAAMVRAGVEFARQNTQPIWLERRLRWTLEAIDRRSG